MSIDEKSKRADKLINKLIFEARDFIWYAAFQYGTIDYFIAGEKNGKFAYDFEYFTFTKSTKTLLSIRTLLKENQNEDVLILLRSIFENYLACRYFNENDEMVDNFIFIPIGLTNRLYYFDSEGKIKDREKNEVDGKIVEPREFKIGKDKDYYYDFYDYLCRYSHCNYGIINDYLDDKHCYTIEKNNNPLLTRLFVIFVFTRLFEHVVTVEGEDFLNERTEKKCYQLVKESILFQDEVFAILIEAYSKPVEKETLKHKQKWMREMLKRMKKALSEEVGSLEKDFIK